MNNNYANQSEIFTLLDGLVSELNRAIDEFKTRNHQTNANSHVEDAHDVKTDHDAELLQLDQNLAADIDVVEKHLADTITSINDATNQKNLLEEKIKDLEGEKHKLSRKLCELKDERNRIHKDWIASHPAQAVAIDSKKMNVANIFRDYFWSEFSTERNDFQRTYWRFYSLITGKCYCVSMFGYDWTFDDVINIIEKHSGTKDIVDFLVSKHS